MNIVFQCVQKKLTFSSQFTDLLNIDIVIVIIDDDNIVIVSKSKN